MALLSDAFNLLKSGHGTADWLFQILESLSDDNDQIVWDVISGIFDGLDKVLVEHKNLSEHLNAFVS